MKKSIAIMCLTVFTFLFLSATSIQAFRCGSNLVTTGDSKTHVQIACGKPTFKESSCKNEREYTTTTKSGNIRKSKKCGQKVEVWHYNCGDNDFIYKLTFEKGILRDEDTEGRGKGKSDCLGR